MKHKIYKIIALLIVLAPFSTNAASVYLETSNNNLTVGDTAVVTVKINAEGAVINTVEGNIMIKSSGNNLAVQEFSLANSSFGLWPRTPSLSVNGKVISFVSGVPGGFSIEGATIFKVIVEAKKEGSVTLSPSDFVAYANDGKGTKIVPKMSDVVIKVSSKKSGVEARDDWKTILANDVTPPQDYIIVLGQDTALYGGKIFAFFSAIDNESGISHYEVAEDGAPAVRSGSTYVLKNQSEDVKLEVVAYDKSGNKKISKYPIPASDKVNWVSVAVSVLVIVFVYFAFKFIFKKVRGSKNNANL
jgi:hypothetical protein